MPGNRPHQGSSRASARKPRRRRKSRLRFAKLWSRLWPSARLRRKMYRMFKRAPAGIQALAALVAVAVVCLTLNWIYQVVRKPSELFFPVSGTLNKTPAQTWDIYAPIFRRHSTAIITPEFLAALAQVEGSGNPVARTYWRWRFSREPFEIYRPASSAVGMYQITDGTFEEERRYCIRDHVVAEDGPWNDFKSCWFNSLYIRTIPSHAVEMTAAHLDRHVRAALQRYGIRQTTLQQKQNLAALIHVCGAGAGERYAARGLRLVPGQSCGDHDVSAYLRRVERMKTLFRRLAAGRSNA